MQAIQDELLCLAKQVLADHAASKMSQTVVLRSKSGKLYACFAALEELPAVEEQLVSQLMGESDTAISHMAVMWENGQIDLPSHRLRNRLVMLDAENRNALLLLQGENSYAFRTLSTTL